MEHKLGSLDAKGEALWKKVCETVSPLDGPRSPRVKPEPADPEPTVLDLHGMTVQEAYQRTRKFLYRHGNHLKNKKVTIITGKSGQIKAEFSEWLDRISTVRSCLELNGGGAFEVKLRPSE